MERRVLICGDRNWRDQLMIIETISRAHETFPITLLIDGDARGADRMAGLVAKKLGLNRAVYPANWELYGKAAGPIRNQQMLDDGRPTEVWVFHDSLESSKGTADMVRRAKRAGIPVWLFTHDSPSGEPV